MSDKIFIQIAAYRDPELLPTIRDCIMRADNPDDLVFAIAWQKSTEDAWDTLESYCDDPRFRIENIDYKEGLGTCWARNILNKQYGGEKYTLQLDSHHRFVRGWDTKCKKMIDDLVAAGYKKPLLTAYVPSYNPENDPQERVKEVWKLTFDRFIPEGAIFMLPAAVENLEAHTLPIPTRFFSAHFVFTYGKFVEEVPYDPNLYFHGEEISMAVRAYTAGYDMFIPNEIICWHEYTRKGRVRHWDENNKWEDLNKKSLKRVKQLLNVDGDGENIDFEFGKYGFGTERKKEDYERFAGIRFKDRAVQGYTLDHFDPPNPIYSTEQNYEASFINRFKHCIDLWKGSTTEPDYDFWAIIFQDEQGNDIYRQDADKYEIELLMNNKENDSQFHNIWREFDTKVRPHKWIVWPHSESKGWLNISEGILPRV